MKFEIKDKFLVDRERYEKEIYFHPEMNERMDQVIDLKTREILEEEENDTFHRKVQRIIPKRELPSALKTVLGGKGLGYVETTTYFKKEHRLDWSIKTEIMSDKIKGGGTINFIEDHGHVIRHVKGEITASVFGVGGLIERSIVDSIKDSYQKASNVTKAWIAERYR